MAVLENASSISVDRSLQQTEFQRARDMLLRAMASCSNNCPPTLLRLAWHDAGCYCGGCPLKGGPRALMRWPKQAADPANKGLDIARNIVADVVQRGGFTTISMADMWQFTADVALFYMGGPKIQFRPGRVDAPESQVTPYNRLPNAAAGFPDFPPAVDHIRNVFGTTMGFTDKEIVALIGAHAMGECHIQNSGFFGPWTPTPLNFTNLLFTELVDFTWQVTPGTQQYDDGKSDGLMMLHTDIALIKDPAFLALVRSYAKDSNLWAADFAVAFQKLQELGITTLQDPINW